MAATLKFIDYNVAMTFILIIIILLLLLAQLISSKMFLLSKLILPHIQVERKFKYSTEVFNVAYAQKPAGSQLARNQKL